MNSDPGVNPYAPPASTSLPPGAGSLPPMKRPLSVKLALLFFTALPLLAVLVYFWLDRRGDLPVRIKLALLIGSTPYLVALVLLLVAGRNRLGYWAGIVGMLYFVIARLGVFEDYSASWGGLIILLLIAWLFVCFAFGRPSRLLLSENGPASNRAPD